MGYLRLAGPTSRSPSGGARPQREMAEAARRRGSPSAPVIIEGRTIATTLLGQGLVRQPRALQRLSRTACRAAGPTCATARSSICRSRTGEVTALVSGSELYKVTITIAPVAEHALEGDLPGLRGRDRFAGRAAAGPLLQGRDGARSAGRTTGLFPAPARDQALAAVARTGRPCASTSRRCSTASARGSTNSPSCCSCCAASMKTNCSPEPGRTLRDRSRRPKTAKVLGDGDVAALFGLGDGRKCQFQHSHRRCLEAAPTFQNSERKQSSRREKPCREKTPDVKTAVAKKSNPPCETLTKLSLNGQPLASARKKRAQRRRARRSA